MVVVQSRHRYPFERMQLLATHERGGVGGQFCQPPPSMDDQKSGLDQIFLDGEHVSTTANTVELGIRASGGDHGEQ